MTLDGEIEVRLGATPEDPNEVRQYDAASGSRSEWIEQGEFIRRIRGKPGSRETIKQINEKIKAAMGERENKPETTAPTITDEPPAERVEEFGNFLADHPRTRLMDLANSITTEGMKRYALAQQLLKRGRLFEHPKTKVLSFRDHLPPKAPVKQVTVRVLKDIKVAVDGDDIEARAEDVVSLPDSTARALIKKGAAEEVLDIAPTSEDVPAAMPMASVPEVETPAEPVSDTGSTEPQAAIDPDPVPSAISITDDLDQFRKICRERGEEAALAWKRAEEAPRVEASPIDWSTVKIKENKPQDAIGKDNVDTLIKLGRQDSRALLFHDAGAVPYARLEVGDHHEVKAIKEQDFSDWLKYQAVRVDGRSPKKDPLNQAIDTIAVLARFEGEEREVYIRKGEQEGAFYYDLCNDQWQAVRITSDGWRVVDDPPVMFRRFDTMRPQSVPLSGRPRALDEMVQLINISEEMRQLLKYHLAAFNVPQINHYNAFFLGPQGSSKSTGNDVVKAMDDPGTDNRDSLPPKEEDLDLHLSRRCTAAYDNISRINQEISDKLTRANSMVRSSRRALYTNNDENSRRYRTKIVLNAIGLDDGVRPDLLDRTIIYNCEVVTESQRLGQEEVNARIEQLRPYALGAALDLLVEAIPIYEQLKGRKGWSPRLKDAYLWMMAVAKVDGMSERDFEALFKKVIERRDSDAMEGDPLAVALEHVAKMGGFVGTAGQLHEWLNVPGLDIPEKCHIDVKDKGWPRSGIALGIHMPRIIAPLRSRGVYVYQCYYFEVDKAFKKEVEGLNWARNDKAYLDQDRMIIISKDDLKRVAAVDPGAECPH